MVNLNINHSNRRTTTNNRVFPWCSFHPQMDPNGTFTKPCSNSIFMTWRLHGRRGVECWWGKSKFGWGFMMLILVQFQQISTCSRKSCCQGRRRLRFGKPWRRHTAIAKGRSTARHGWRHASIMTCASTPCRSHFKRFRIICRSSGHNFKCQVLLEMILGVIWFLQTVAWIVCRTQCKDM